MRNLNFSLVMLIQRNKVAPCDTSKIRVFWTYRRSYFMYEAIIKQRFMLKVMNEQMQGVNAHAYDERSEPKNERFTKSMK